MNEVYKHIASQGTEATSFSKAAKAGAHSGVIFKFLFFRRYW